MGRSEVRGPHTHTHTNDLTNAHTYLEVKGHLRVAASPEAGRSQQAVDPVRHPAVKSEVSLDNPAFPIIDKDFSLFRDKRSAAFSAPSPPPAVFHSRWRPSLRSGRTAVNPAESEPGPGGPDVQQKPKGQTTYFRGRTEELVAPEDLTEGLCTHVLVLLPL